MGTLRDSPCVSAVCPISSTLARHLTTKSMPGLEQAALEKELSGYQGTTLLIRNSFGRYGSEQEQSDAEIILHQHMKLQVSVLYGSLWPLSSLYGRCPVCMAAVRSVWLLSGLYGCCPVCMAAVQSVWPLSGLCGRCPVCASLARHGNLICKPSICSRFGLHSLIRALGKIEDNPLVRN